MASTSQTSPSNSLIPTSTSASVTSSQPADTSDSNGASSPTLFPPGGSPPLIVAFLAIGLFIIAITSIFGWRRLRQLRRLDSQPVVPIRPSKSMSLGGKPVLWDVWANVSGQEKSSVDATGWKNMTPMTAILTFLVVEPSPPSKSVDPASRVPFLPLRLWRWLASALGRFYLPDPPLPPPPPSPPPDEERDGKEVVRAGSGTLDEIEWGGVSSLQVAIIVAMPSQRWRGEGTSGKEADEERRTELGEFCIGRMDMPWNESG